MLRREMKNAAKESMRNARPHPVVMTLVLILMTTGISFLVQGVLAAAYGIRLSVIWSERSVDIYKLFYYYAGTGGVTALVFINILIGLYSLVVNFGYMGCLLHVSRDEPASFGNLLDGFALAGKVIALNLLMGLFIFLWYLLFVVPGFIAAYRYRMSVYILLDDPDCGVLEAISRSKEMMAGYKMDLFVLDISFINWVLLFIPIVIITVVLSSYSPILGGVVFYLLLAGWSLWMMPFFTCTQANFYNNLIGIHRTGGSWSSGPDVRF